ncbi:MAG TPA: YwaF family protein [Clostridia bacterium]
MNLNNILSIDFKEIGYFSFQHLVTLFLLFAVIVVMLCISNRFFPKSTLLQIRILCIIAWIAEATKILVTYAIGDLSWKNGLPIYFCSLFLYSSIFAGFSKKPALKLIGNSSLMSGVVAGFFGMLYSPALKYYPVYHFLGIHTLVFHAVMIYCGLLVLTTEHYIPKIKDILYSTILLLSLTVAAIIANKAFDANYMFIEVPLAGAPTYIIVQIFGELLYSPVVVLGQLFLPFLIMFGLYKLVTNFQRKRTSQKAHAENV